MSNSIVNNRSKTTTNNNNNNNKNIKKKKVNPFVGPKSSSVNHFPEFPSWTLPDNRDFSSASSSSSTDSVVNRNAIFNYNKDESLSFSMMRSSIQSTNSSDFPFGQQQHHHIQHNTSISSANNSFFFPPTPQHQQQQQYSHKSSTNNNSNINNNRLELSIDTLSALLPVNITVEDLDQTNAISCDDSMDMQSIQRWKTEDELKTNEFFERPSFEIYGIKRKSMSPNPDICKYQQDNDCSDVGVSILLENNNNHNNHFESSSNTTASPFPSPMSNFNFNQNNNNNNNNNNSKQQSCYIQRIPCSPFNNNQNNQNNNNNSLYFDENSFSKHNNNNNITNNNNNIYNNNNFIIPLTPINNTLKPYNQIHSPNNNMPYTPFSDNSMMSSIDCSSPYSIQQSPFLQPITPINHNRTKHQQQQKNLQDFGPLPDVSPIKCKIDRFATTGGDCTMGQSSPPASPMKPRNVGLFNKFSNA
ncbi:hypothetical protein DFA_07522 [Cavenderia fasciculata]|uniref:Uncharacterized protein n=1 Tax=Cavenderia fasciculata TaxID=261658 RepID=F4PWN4_CACFS|nr:uncharacterized protein DFA_07522 [Cavenderia fasciculata]EGG20398.1 hypothetical protein DFA_07522 [Cavenderia fasciculata]|eukprot:XP_004367381.1 hypothetical protein DFA_07522 [Cavenderia fasciculata]